MKKLLVSLLLFFGALSFTHAQNGNMIKNGFGLKFQFGFPTAGFASDVDVPSSGQIPVTYGLQLGNQWYVYKQDKKFGIAINVNWLDITSGTKGISTSSLQTVNNDDIKRLVLDMSFIEIGPLATIAFSDKLAVDGYFNLRPTFMGNYLQGNGETVGHAGFGLTSSVGAGLRFGKLYVGFESNFGSVTGKRVGDEEFQNATQSLDEDDLTTDVKLSANQTKLIFGFKF